MRVTEKRKIQVLIWPGAHDWMDAGIKFCTHGSGCHASFLLPDDTITEAFWPRVRNRPYLPADKRLTEVYDVDFLSHEASEALELILSQDVKADIRYSIGDLIRFALNRPVADEKHTFCSRYVLHRLSKVLAPEQMPLVRLPFGDWGSPRDLRISPRLRMVGSGVFSLTAKDTRAAVMRFCKAKGTY